MTEIPKIRKDISLGNIFTIITFVIGLTAGWTQLKADQATLDKRITDLEQDRRERSRQDLLMAQTLTEMRADIKYTRLAVERLERDGSNGTGR